MVLILNLRLSIARDVLYCFTISIKSNCPPRTLWHLSVGFDLFSPRTFLWGPCMRMNRSRWSGRLFSSRPVTTLRLAALCDHAGSSFAHFMASRLLALKTWGIWSPLMLSLSLLAFFSFGQSPYPLCLSTFATKAALRKPYTPLFFTPILASLQNVACTQNAFPDFDHRPPDWQQSRFFILVNLGCRLGLPRTCLDHYTRLCLPAS